MTAQRSLPEGYTKKDSLDFRNNRRQLVVSYVLRLTSLAVFVPVFASMALLFHQELRTSLVSPLNIAIPGLPNVVSVLFVIIDVIAVLSLHELIHASVFWTATHGKFKIGIRGVVLFAAASEWYLPKRHMIINALAPFVVITIIGIILMVVLPAPLIPWVYIPIVINAAAAAGDFMMVAWVAKHDHRTLFYDEGDATFSYAPSP
jgi:hypothetical protein